MNQIENTFRTSKWIHLPGAAKPVDHHPETRFPASPGFPG